MRSKLVLGRYIDTGSFIHRLDPRAKITAMILYMVSIFMVTSYTEVLVVTVFSLGIMYLTKIPFAYFLRAVKPLAFIILFIFGFHLLFDVGGGSRLIEMGPVSIYTGGLERGILAALRMILFISFTAILTFTTPPATLTQGLSELLQPLKWIRLSPQKMTLMFSISLRFIPTIFEEAEKILKAQASRGMDIADRPFHQKAKQLISLLVPVTVGAFRRAVELVEAMESRGYRLRGQRSQYFIMVWQKQDTLFMLCFVILVMAVMAVEWI